MQKLDTDAAPVVRIAVSAPRSLREVTDIADKKIKQQIESISGVGDVQIIGGRTREIEILGRSRQATRFHRDRGPGSRRRKSAEPGIAGWSCRRRRSRTHGAHDWTHRRARTSSIIWLLPVEGLTQSNSAMSVMPKTERKSREPKRV